MQKYVLSVSTAFFFVSFPLLFDHLPLSSVYFSHLRGRTAYILLSATAFFPALLALLAPKKCRLIEISHGDNSVKSRFMKLSPCLAVITRHFMRLSPCVVPMKCRLITRNGVPVQVVQHLSALRVLHRQGGPAVKTGQKALIPC